MYFEVKWNVGLNFAEKASKESKESQDSYIDILKYADRDCFPNRRKRLGLTEAERAVSGVRRLKTPYRARMGDKRESDLNFLLSQRIKKVDPEEVLVLLIDLDKRKLFNEKITA